MDAARWERVQDLFHRVAELGEVERITFLENLTGDDAGLAPDVRSLLEEDARDSLIDRDLSSVAADVVAHDSALDSIPQHTFGAYHILRVLGEGGMGVVYLAERDDLKSKAAVKILRDAWLSPARRERFVSEQKNLARLEHRSIARLYDSGTLADGTPWFVMEHVEGASITEYCRAKSCTLRERLALFREVCEAVQYAHTNLIVHRDLKPSNILVREDGSVKLLDFGISKQLTATGDATEQTRTAVRMMTPAYAAPEQIRGEPAGLHTDIYALGVILYELLVGRLPFDLTGHSPAEAERILLERDPERPSAAARRMKIVSPNSAPSIGRSEWSDLDVLCATAMHKEPERRYRTVEALIRDVDHFSGQEPLEARSDSTAYRFGKFARRNRAALSAAAAVILAVVSLTTFYTVRLADARDSALAEASRSERLRQFTVNLLQGGDDEVGPADSLRVVSLIDRGVQEARSLGHEPELQAQMFSSLGAIYRQLGKLEQADTLLRLSLRQQQAMFKADHDDIAHTLVQLGMVMNARAEYDSAEVLVARGLEMRKRLLPADHPAVARATAQLGQVLEESGNYDRAIAVLDEGMRNHSLRAVTTPEVGAMMTELANAHFYKGNYAKSDTLNRAVLAIDRRIRGPSHPSVADDLINLGAIQFEFGNFKEAERFYREGLEITRPWYGNNHPATAANLTMLGRALVSQQRLDEGAEVLTEAVAINERAFGPVHPRVASALNELGRVAQQQGRLDEAEANFRRMASIYRTVHNDKHYVIGVALSNIAGVMKDRKKYGEAALIFEEVLRRYRDVLEPEHQLVGIAKVRYAEVLQLDRRHDDAEREALAGYAILTKQSSPPEIWMNRARVALASAFQSNGKAGLAAKYRAEVTTP